MPTNESLRESLESARRAKLHRQIGALRYRLNQWSKCRCPRHDREFLKLLNKTKRLEASLNQPMLLDISGWAVESGRRSGAEGKRRRAG